MSRGFQVVWLGKTRKASRDPWELLCADYRERIGRFQPIVDVPLRPPANLAGRERLAAEAERVRSALPDPCRVVVLDRRGDAWSSKVLATSLARWLDEWPHPIAFVLGSDLGIDPQLAAAAFARWSLGPLTLPHSLARLVAYEQLYRALSLRAGIKYHREPL